MLQKRTPLITVFAKKKLKPLGIDIRAFNDDECLPFDNEMFDIIINRHEAFDTNEIYRLLKPGGLFITQQVGGQNNKGLSKFLINDLKEIIDGECDLKSNITEMKNKGLKILYSNEYFPRLRFFDVGALVYFAKIIEWEFPNFSVENYFDKLRELYFIIEKQGFIESTEHRYMLTARKV